MEAFIEALKAESADLNRQAAELRTRSKGDEAVFRTVRANVYDICATVCHVHLKRGGPSVIGGIFARFQDEWSAALETAKRQDNARKICIEEEKTEALADVRARFAMLGCEK